MNFDRRYFQPLSFTPEQWRQYFASAERDVHIAQTAKLAEIQFTFAYNALIKIGIALIAANGYKVRSQPGHHVKIIDVLSRILKDENIALMGDAMRQKRNLDLYDGGDIITDAEGEEYAAFVAQVLKRAEKLNSEH
ncbi:MAG: hypothetical protein M0Q92_12605 [Methanoregula sp.]|jgi:hypothetical protein|nr:hypothetical protein [Methanoregula sp.]